MRLLLVRHGQTSSNIGHHLDTAEPGADLSALGVRQAEAVPAALSEQHIDLIVTSTLVRTQQTAAPLARERGIEPWVRAGIREISAGELEMRNDEQAIHRYIDGVFDWGVDIDRRMPGGETGREVLTRYDEVVGEAARVVGDGTAVLVSHGAVIRYWAGARGENLDVEYASAHWLPNTAMLTMEGSPQEGWRLVEWLEEPLGGDVLADLEHTGPGGEPEE